MKTAAFILCALLVGYVVGRASHQNVNELQRAGFIVVDPDGYECERFDEGITRFPSYWTTAQRTQDKET